MEELSDEYMNFENLSDVFAFDVSQHVYEPLEVPVRRTDP